MERSLFTDEEISLDNKKKDSYYNEVLENRKRPDILFNENDPNIKKEGMAEEPKQTTKKELQKYLHKEVLDSATVYFQGDTLAASVWMNKYGLKDSEGHLYELTPDDMHHRIASEIARIEQKYPNPLTEEVIFELLKDFKYVIPQGSPMAGIGNNFQVASLSNCFVIGNNGN